jgi:hypothetical protein
MKITVPTEQFYLPNMTGPSACKIVMIAGPNAGINIAGNVKPRKIKIRSALLAVRVKSQQPTTCHPKAHKQANLATG